MSKCTVAAYIAALQNIVGRINTVLTLADNGKNTCRSLVKSVEFIQRDCVVNSQNAAAHILSGASKANDRNDVRAILTNTKRLLMANIDMLISTYDGNTQQMIDPDFVFRVAASAPKLQLNRQTLNEIKILLKHCEAKAVSVAEIRHRLGEIDRTYDLPVYLQTILVNIASFDDYNRMVSNIAGLLLCITNVANDCNNSDKWDCLLDVMEHRINGDPRNATKPVDDTAGKISEMYDLHEALKNWTLNVSSERDNDAELLTICQKFKIPHRCKADVAVALNPRLIRTLSGRVVAVRRVLRELKYAIVEAENFPGL